MRRSADAEAEVEGRPPLAFREEDREAIAEMLAETLVDALESLNQHPHLHLPGPFLVAERPVAAQSSYTTS